MPRGSNAKREHEFEELVDEFKKQERYQGREEEVAARIVNKQRAEHGETQDAKQAAKEGEAPDRDLPIARYDHLTVDQIASQLEDLSAKEIASIERYEKDHRNRKTLLAAIERRSNS